MCLECFQLYGVSLDPAHHATIKRRPNRHVRRVKPSAAKSLAPTESGTIPLKRAALNRKP